MLVLGELSWVFFRSYFRFKRFLAARQFIIRFFALRWLQAILDSKKQLKNPNNLIDFKKLHFLCECSQKANLACLASKSASILCQQSNPYKTAQRALASIQAVLYRLYAAKQTPISEALVSQTKAHRSLKAQALAEAVFALAKSNKIAQAWCQPKNS